MTANQTCSQCHYPLGDRPVRYPSGKTYCRRCAYPTDPDQWGEAWHEVRLRPADEPQRCACGERLLAPISQQRGYCERCRLAGEAHTTEGSDLPAEATTDADSAEPDLWEEAS